MDGGFKIHALCFFVHPIYIHLPAAATCGYTHDFWNLWRLGVKVSVWIPHRCCGNHGQLVTNTLQHLVFYFPLANCHGVYRWCLYNMMLEFLFRYVSIDSSHAPHVSRTEQRISSKRPPVWRRLCRLAIPQTPQVTTRSVQIGTAQDFTSAESSQQAKVKPNVSVECLDLAKFKNASVELRFCSGSDACVLTSKTVRC